METPKNILITGASGLIGSRLTEILSSRGATVATLSRAARSGTRYHWDVENGILDEDALTDTDAIVHLAGASVGEKRWTAARKAEILKSRTESTRLLYERLKKGNHRVKQFISASAIGYYGFEDETNWFDEQSNSGHDYLAQVTRAWENEVDKIATLDIRVVKIRIGIVLSAAGGALVQMANPVRYFAGAPLGSGRQPVSWIHIEDVCEIFVKAIYDQFMQGPYNAVAPNPVDNKTMTQLIGKALNKPVFLPPVPGFVLKAIIGQMAEIVVTGNLVSAKKIMDAGYRFRFENAEEAINDLLKKPNQ
ncbi:MAG TPA: TIGR01777 family oxidoreductase [Chryseosolibacter sp.]